MKTRPGSYSRFVFGLLTGLVAALVACGGAPTAPSLRTLTITDSLSSVGTMAADYRVYPVDVARAGALTASVRWVGEGALWLFIFDEEPPTNAPALAQSDQHAPANPATASAQVPRAGRYFVLVEQSIVPAGPARGSCRCRDDFTLTLTYP
jgi:hypothetical protein